MLKWLATGAALAALTALGGCEQNAGDSALAKQAALEAANEEKALYCFDLLFNQQEFEKSEEECWGEPYIQHNPHAPDGKDAMFAHMRPIFEQYPDLQIYVKRVAAVDDLVWIHYHSLPTPEGPGLAAVDIVRLKDGKFVEHWDVVQPVPEESANENTMF